MSERWTSLRVDEVPPIKVARRAAVEADPPHARDRGVRHERVHGARTPATTSSSATARRRLRHEEVYVVLSGRATLRARRRDARRSAPGRSCSSATPTVRRYATAAEPGTTVLAVGGKPGEAYTPSAWEWYFEAERFRDPFDPEAALRLMARGERALSRACRASSTRPPAGRHSPAGPTTPGRRSSARSSSTRGRANGRSATRTSPRSATGSTRDGARADSDESRIDPQRTLRLAAPARPAPLPGAATQQDAGAREAGPARCRRIPAADAQPPGVIR